MRKVRDYDAELKALAERAKQVQQKKIQQFGELVEATRADTLDPDVLAGALLHAVDEKDNQVTGGWRARGVEFFHEKSRKSSRRARPDSGAGKENQASAQPDRSGTSAS